MGPVAIIASWAFVVLVWRSPPRQASSVLGLGHLTNMLGKMLMPLIVIVVTLFVVYKTASKGSLTLDQHIAALTEGVGAVPSVGVIVVLSVTIITCLVFSMNMTANQKKMNGNGTTVASVNATLDCDFLYPFLRKFFFAAYVVEPEISCNCKWYKMITCPCIGRKSSSFGSCFGNGHEYKRIPATDHDVPENKEEKLESLLSNVESQMAEIRSLLQSDENLRRRSHY